MSRLRRFEIIDSSSFPFPFPPFPEELNLDLLNPTTAFDTITDLIQIQATPFTSTYHHYYQTQTLQPPFSLHSLSDRVSELERGFKKIAKEKAKKVEYHDRKYSWTAEINSVEKDGVDKKYKWVTEIKGGKKEERNYKYIAEFKGKGKASATDRKYIFKASSVPVNKEAKKTQNLNKKAKDGSGSRVVEIEDSPVDQRAIVLKQAFAKRGGGGGDNGKGKKKELSPQDAAMMIQISFRAYLVRRSQVLRALRDLAVAKAKLKEIRALFSNFSYRRRIARDAEERQKFSEKIIVLLLTVDAIEGADLIVRATRRSIVDELEAMLDVVDPQSPGKLGSMKRRTFDMPDAAIQKEIAAGVAEVVQMLDWSEKNGANTVTMEELE